MNSSSSRLISAGSVIINSLMATAVLLITIPTSQAHHSFAMYNMGKITTFTGVVTRVDPNPNHLQVFFAPMNEDRKNVERDEDGDPVLWAVEMGGSAMMAREGISVNSFPRGTVFSISMHPLRNGENAGAMEGGLFQCPEKTPPAPGMHCDSVEGSKQFFGKPLEAEK